jgi:hypothetical protein
MKKFNKLEFRLLAIFAFWSVIMVFACNKASAQVLDTTVLRQQITDSIKPNRTNSITASQLQRILLGNINTLRVGLNTRYATNDTLLGGVTTYKRTKKVIDSLDALKGAANGFAPLNSSSLISSAYLPPLNYARTFVVSSAASMLALTSTVGDVAVRTDSGNRAFILVYSPATTRSNWLLVSPTVETDPVYAVSAAAGISGTNISNWNTSYGWGNHSGLYPLLSASYSNPSWITALDYSKLTGAPTDNTSFTNGAAYHTSATGDLRYLKIDASNSPLTGMLEISRIGTQIRLRRSSYYQDIFIGGDGSLIFGSNDFIINPSHQLIYRGFPQSSSSSAKWLASIDGSSGDSVISAISPTNALTMINAQSKLNGTGFVKALGTTITYDPNSYLTSIPTNLVTTSVIGTSSLSTVTLTASTLNGSLAATNITGVVPILHGGTSGTTASLARTNLENAVVVLNLPYGLNPAINSIDLSTALYAGQYLIYVSMIRGGASGNVTYSALYMFTHYYGSGGTDVLREILSPDSAGSGYGNIFSSGSSVGISWTGNRGEAIITVQTLQGGIAPGT